MKAVLILALAACAFAAVTYKNDPFWISYKKQFNKVYSAAEEPSRYAIFQRNMARASELNEIDTASYGWTAFSDQERKRGRLDIPAFIRRTEVDETDGLPEEFDWRKKGAVAEVKNQEQCGSCWAFCAVAAMEGAYFLQHNELLSLSEQQILDCDTDDHGCSGGWPTDALEFVKKHGGMMLESDYGYEGYEDTCRFDSSKVVMEVKSVHTFSARNEKKIMTALEQYGPLAIAVDASKFDYYSSGIMNGEGCAAGQPDHGVTIVGWGVEGDTKFWIVKNSWGEDWGENGYVRMVRGENACGVEDYPMGVVSK